MKHLITYTVFSKPKEATFKLQERNREIAHRLGGELIAIAPEPCPAADVNIILEPCGLPLDLFTRINAGLCGIPDDDEVYLVEDDIIYTEEHFKLTPKYRHVNYNLEVIYISERGYFDMYSRCGVCLHQAFGDALTMRRAVMLKLKEIADYNFSCYEPCSPYFPSCTCRTNTASLDIRNGMNSGDWTDNGEMEYFDNLKGWGEHKKIWEKWGF